VESFLQERLAVLTRVLDLILWLFRGSELGGFRSEKAVGAFGVQDQNVNRTQSRYRIRDSRVFKTGFGGTNSMGFPNSGEPASKSLLGSNLARCRLE
jgi:hypothetical protein